MKKYITVMLLVNIGLLVWGYHSMILPYRSKVSLLMEFNDSMAKVMEQKDKEYTDSIKELQDKHDALSELLVQTQEDLELFHTFKKAGLKGESVETIRELSEKAQQLPFGSPFRDGHTITDKFGVRDERWFNGNGWHEGIDIVSRGSWIVLTTADGMVTDYGENDTYGKWIEYTTDSGYVLIYAHLGTIYYQEGTKVKGIHLTKGMRLGKMGNTGLTSGPHLHFEIRMQNSQGELVNLDPEEIINYIGK